MMQNATCRFVAGLVVVALVACSPGAGDDALAGQSVGLTITVDLSGVQATLLVVTVTGPGIQVPIVANLDVDGNGVAQGIVSVPVGSARVFNGAAFDDAGDVTHEGEAVQDVRPGMASVRIPLLPRSVGVPIEAVVAAVEVAIAPGSVTIDIGESMTFTATVTSDGAVLAIAPGDLTWGSTNPAFVQVTGSGVATGFASGVAQIVVSYAGVAAAADVTVAVSGEGGEGEAGPLAEISPAVAYTDSTLQCAALFTAVGPLSFQWSVDEQNTGQTSSSLGSQFFVRDNEVRCDVTDGTSLGTAFRTIVNKPPQLTSLNIDGQPVLGETLTCLATFADADGDPLTISHQWFRTRDEVVAEVASAEELVLSTELFEVGDAVSCWAYAFDGSDYGTCSEEGSSVCPIPGDFTLPTVTVVP